MNTVTINSVSRLERHKQRTRQALMQAAYTLIMEQGYESLTVSAIADAAGYGRATFYLYFADKEDIVWHLMQRHYETENERVIASVHAEPFPRREYLGWRGMFEDVARNAPFYRRLGGVRAVPLWERSRQYLLLQVEHHLTTGNYATNAGLPVPFMARFIVGAMLEVMRWWAENDYQPSAEQMADMLFTMVFHIPPPDASLFAG